MGDACRHPLQLPPQPSSFPCLHLPACLLQLKEKKAALARLETLDMGKPVAESEWDMDDVAGCFEYYAGRSVGGWGWGVGGVWRGAASATQVGGAAQFAFACLLWRQSCVQLRAAAVCRTQTGGGMGGEWHWCEQQPACRRPSPSATSAVVVSFTTPAAPCPPACRPGRAAGWAAGRGGRPGY